VIEKYHQFVHLNYVGLKTTSSSKNTRNLGPDEKMKSKLQNEEKRINNDRNRLFL